MYILFAYLNNLLTKPIATSSSMHCHVVLLGQNTVLMSQHLGTKLRETEGYTFPEAHSVVYNVKVTNVEKTVLPATWKFLLTFWAHCPVRSTKNLREIDKTAEESLLENLPAIDIDIWMTSAIKWEKPPVATKRRKVRSSGISRSARETS